MRKVIFFDIDGTLVNAQGQWPASSREAIDRARANGHKVFLCTGRNEVQIYPFLREYGFDGVISATGAMVTCEGKELYHSFVEERALDRCIDFFEGRPLCFGLQAASGNYMDEAGYHFLEERLEQYNLGSEVLASVTEGMQIVPSIRGHRDVEKMFYFECPEDVEQVQKALGEEFLVLESSLPIPGKTGGAGEITQRRINKSFGIQKVLEHYGLTREDAVAFGDAPNDMDMLEYAGVGIAMGNAKEEVKEKADFVTDHIDEDGVLHAMEKFSLI